MLFDKENLLEIKDLLISYRSNCINKASFYENECTNCLRGNCKDCSQPEREEANRCYKIIKKIEDYLCNLENS